MADLLERISSVAVSARRDRPPEIDVARRVIYRLRSEEQSIENPLARFAAVSLAPAAASIIIFISFYYFITDPVNSMFYTAATLIP